MSESDRRLAHYWTLQCAGKPEIYYEEKNLGRANVKSRYQPSYHLMRMVPRPRLT
jgi:hypothetical protein